MEVLPTLSVANVRTLLKAAMPLPQLTPEAATALVIKHLVNRTRSRKSRVKNPAASCGALGLLPQLELTSLFFLILDIPSDYVCRHLVSHRANEIPISPQFPSP